MRSSARSTPQAARPSSRSPGHDLKLGRGGIREIEFFVQTQQLILGGRHADLRGARTLDVLAALAADGWITPRAADELSAAYRYLRARRAPGADDRRRADPAPARGRREPEKFRALLRLRRDCAVFAWPAAPSSMRWNDITRGYSNMRRGSMSRAGNLVFTGAADDPETLETLRDMGFRDPALAAETVRGWHFGRRPAVRSPRAREALTELVPALLEAFSRSGDADSGLAALDAALALMPAAVELFALLKSHEAMLELFADILGGAPRLAQVIARSPHVLDAAIDRGVAAAPMEVADFSARLAPFRDADSDFEAFLDAARVFAGEENFMIGLRLFAGLIEPDQAARGYSALAEAVVRACLARVEKHFAAEHGVVVGGRCVVLGLGKLGSRELTATSDLDLVLLYDFDDDHPESEGGRPLPATLYYTRLTQRLIAALTAPTRRGKLFDVDMRLRPSGRQGPLATQYASFRAYQADDAEIWEHMALTRARPVAGAESLAAETVLTIEDNLFRPRDRVELAQVARDMRALIAKEKGEDDPWNLKLASGGLLDVEFIAQFLALGFGDEFLALRRTATADIIAEAGKAGILDPETAEFLLKALALYAKVTQWLRLALGEDADPRHAAKGVKRRIAAAAGLPDVALLERELAETRKGVRRVFGRVLTKG